MDVAKLRAAVAAEYDISLYRQYGEKSAATIWGVDVSTAKRWRREQSIPFVEMPNGGIKYLGFQIVDVLIFGKQAPQRYREIGAVPRENELCASREVKGSICQNTRNEHFNAENGTSAAAGTPPHGIGHGMTAPVDKRSVSASAQLTKVLRKND